MKNVIIGIHGLSNKPEPQILKEGWQDAILEGLKKNVDIDLKTLNFVSVYWADVMYDDVDPDPKLYHPAKRGAIKRYDDNWLDFVRKEASDFGGDIIDKIKSFFGMDAFADKILKAKMNDLYQYYHNKEKRKELRNRLIEQIEKNKENRILILAHSMGTIIAYDVLRELGRKDQKLTIDHFVTIGSPLGMPHVKYKIAKENALVRTPSIVKKWTNFADKRDPVAIDPHLSDDYKPNDSDVQVKDDLVLNDWGGINHKSYGYLRTPEVTDVLKKFI